MTPTNALPAPLAKLVRRREVADRTVAFEFEKPPRWTFKAGQAVDVTLLEPPESDGESFSVLSRPVLWREHQDLIDCQRSPGGILDGCHAYARYGF